MELNEKGLPFFPELRFEDKRHIYTLGGQVSEMLELFGEKFTIAEMV